MNSTGHPAADVFTVERPWGNFQQFLSNAPASVKIITVEPNQRLSLQRHQFRDELWQVIDGPVDVVVDDQPSTVGVGGRVWVPRGSVHRMGNTSAQDVRVLEIAFGFFDEDDIERLKDDYARLPVAAVQGSVVAN